MKTHMKMLAMIGIIVGLFPWSVVSAADETGPWLCAPIQEIECEQTGECKANASESLNLPSFIKIDLAAKQASGVEDGKEEVAAIQRVEHADGRLILQGTQNGRGWSAVIVEETGKMTLSVSGEDTAWLAFGACTPLANWVKDGASAGTSTTKTPAE
jgi:hypothetical protein